MSRDTSEIKLSATLDLRPPLPKQSLRRRRGYDASPAARHRSDASKRLVGEGRRAGGIKFALRIKSVNSFFRLRKGSDGIFTSPGIKRSETGPTVLDGGMVCCQEPTGCWTFEGLARPSRFPSPDLCLTPTPPALPCHYVESHRRKGRVKELTSTCL